MRTMIEVVQYDKLRHWQFEVDKRALRTIDRQLVDDANPIEDLPAQAGL
jgi:hypothetical protein